MESIIVYKETVKSSFQIIYGDDNEIIGNNNIIYGDRNEIVGNNNTIYGNSNAIYGKCNTIRGSNNKDNQGAVKRTNSRKSLSMSKDTALPEFEEGEQAEEENACVICMERKKTTACVPCGHIIYCVKCVWNMKEQRSSISCSVCCNSIEKVIKVFM